MKSISRSVFLAACVLGAASAVQSTSAQAPAYTWVLLAGGESSYHRDDVGTRARFNRPEAIVQDASGVIYVADSGSHTIRRVGTDLSVTTIAGAPNESGSADGNGTAARFNRPSDIVIDSNGVLWIADSGNYTIRRMATNGDVTTIAGVAGSEGTADGTGSAARFGFVSELTSDASGNLYLAETVQSTPGRIRRVTPGGEVTTLAGFSGATGIAVTSTGLYVSSSFYTVQRLNGTSFEVLAGLSGESGFDDGPGAAARFGLIGAMTTDALGNVIVSDGERRRRVTPEGMVTTLPSVDVRGVYPNLGNVSSIIARADGSFILASAETRIIKEFSAAQMFSTVAGSMGHGTTDGLRTTAEFFGPMQLSLDQRGNLIVSDSVNHTIRRVAPDGMVTTVSGFGRVPSYAGGAALDARYRYPSAVTAPDGTITLIDGFNMLIRRVAGGTVMDVAGQLGQSGHVDGTGTDARVNVSQILTPSQMALDSAGTAYLADSFAHTVRTITSTGVVSTFAGVAGAVGSADGTGSEARFTTPMAVARDAAGHLYVTQQTAVRRITPAGVVSTITTARGGTAIAVDTDGTLLVADGDLYRLALDGDRTTVGKPDFGVIGGVAIGPGREIYLSMHNNMGSEVNRLWIGLPSSAAAPAIDTITSQTVMAGQPATFTTQVTGMPTPGVQWQRSTDGGTTWSDLAEAAPFSGTSTASLTISATTTAMHTHQFRVRAVNLDGAATSNAATLSVNGITASPSILRFASREFDASGFRVSTSAQRVTVGTVGTVAPWTAVSSQPWAVVSGGSGTGAGQFTIGIDNAALTGLGGTLSATVTVAATGGTPTATVSVVLELHEGTGFRNSTFGVVDTPLQNATGVQGAVSISGWALSDIGVGGVKIYRNCTPVDTFCVPTGLPAMGTVIELGDATFVEGMRPDVEAAYPTAPANNRAGWGFMILTNMLPDIPGGRAQGGVGPITLYAVAFGGLAAPKLIGRTVLDEVPTAITLANDTIAKPFGAIDTPTQGGTASGLLHNFGWTLTPDPGTGVLVPTDGSTITVYIDGAPVGTTQYNLCRGTVGSTVPAGVLCDDDVSTAFRGAGTLFRNLDAGRGPIALRTISTTALTNGLHTISWGVTDSANRSEGIGSRYFTVLNSAADRCVSAACEVRSAAEVGRAELEARRDRSVQDHAALLFARTGFDLLAAYTPLVPDAAGIPQVRIPELGRVELQIPGVTGGALLVNGEARPLPIGVGIDTERGIVTWIPGVGHLGTYRLSFGRTIVDATVSPASTSDEPLRMHLDSPTQGLVLSERSVRVEGWAFDPQSASGAGIGAVHVWARRIVHGPTRSTVQGSEPIFLGVADLNIPRPDVAAAHGAQFVDAGFRLHTTLPAGEWEVTAYVWVARTGRFEDARSVRLTIR